MEVTAKTRRIVPAKEVDRRCGTTPAQRWREEKDGRFPQRVQITPYRVGYYEDEIDGWVENRPRGGAAIETPRSPGRRGKLVTLEPEAA